MNLRVSLSLFLVNEQPVGDALSATSIVVFIEPRAVVFPFKKHTQLSWQLAEDINARRCVDHTGVLASGPTRAAWCYAEADMRACMADGLAGGSKMSILVASKVPIEARWRLPMQVDLRLGRQADPEHTRWVGRRKRSGTHADNHRSGALPRDAQSLHVELRNAVIANTLNHSRRAC